ncbi:MAG: outer membrane lipoprotein-sorting protein [Bacteroidales bacterium]|nr:outer membrane lipoprotein-sorting protein [Bacteroidales bacterium]
MKKTATAFAFFIGVLVSLPFQAAAQQSLTAKQVVDKANKNMEGDSSVSRMSMTIVRPSWQRTIEFKNWVKGTDYALTLITAPAKEQGQTFLKRGNNMWNWLPKIHRLIKLPPSMMSQGWMGSDYTNDDILKQSSLTEDYDHRFDGEETLENRLCYRIEMIPHEESTVVWGKLITWISKKDFIFMKTEYYDEDGYLVRTEKAGDIKKMGGRFIPTRLEIIPADETRQKTVVLIHEMNFNVNLKDSFFSQQNMKQIH